MTEEPREILIVHNLRSRKGQKVARRARDHLRQKGLSERASWIEIGDLALLPAPVRPPERVLAIGGDGTVNAAASWVLAAGSESLMGIVPAGTGNNLARELGIPGDPERALSLGISGREVRRIDAIRYLPLDGGERRGDLPAGRIVVQSGQLGFPAEINARFHQLRRNRLFRAAASPLGFLIYRVLALAGLAVVSRRERRGDRGARLGLRAAFPEEQLEAETFAVFVGNGNTLGGGFHPCPNAVLDDGLMDLCLIRSGTGHSYLGLFRDVLRGRHLERKDAVEYRQTPGPLDLHFSRPAQFLADGDIWMTAKSYRLEMIPKAIGVVVGE